MKLSNAAGEKAAGEELPYTGNISSTYKKKADVTIYSYTIRGKIKR